MKTLTLLLAMNFLINAESVTQNGCYTKEGYVAAISEKYLQDCIRYSIDKDMVALNKLYKAGVIVDMKAGIKVFVVDTHLFDGTVEFRLPGNTLVLWTVVEAIKCK